MAGQVDRQEHALSKCLPFVERLKHQHRRTRCAHATVAHKIIIMVAINRKRTRGCIFTRARTCALRRGIPPFISCACPTVRIHRRRRIQDDAKDEGRREGERSARAQPSAARLYCAISACPRALWCCSDLRRAVFRWRDSPTHHRVHFFRRNMFQERLPYGKIDCFTDLAYIILSLTSNFELD